MNASIVRLAAAILIAGITASTSFTTVRADDDECRAAVNRYNSAADDVFYALKRYSNCVAGSQGHDDCSGEFRRVRSAQDDFESVVSEYGRVCD